MSYLLDTDVLIDATKGRPVAARWIQQHVSDGLSISVISVAELYDGSYRTVDPVKNLASLRHFLLDFQILPVSDAIAEIFGRERASLARSGRMIADMDILIAATTLHHNLTLVTRNVRHFQRIPGLTIETPE